MKLTRLTLQGYKTFASKSEFYFDDGITAIVGPNGSGKSNIADALRWVLGEQSYGALRGKRTADMIFAGSEKRARAGMAQVTLTLDNSDGWLPIEYTEVEIGRRAYRSGENEYLINGQKVRLKDLTDLLATSGLAERTYTIIGQGLIDQALSLRAEERRALFEEAAGINHYKLKRASTLRQLEETQRNLQRVHDILAEIQPRLASLRRQATRARNYEQIIADLRHLLRIWYGYRWEQAKGKLRQARQAAVATESAWQESRNQLLALQSNMADLRQRINHRQQQVTELQSQRDDLRDRLERSQREAAILQERRQSLQQQLAEIAQEIALLEQQRIAAAAELEQAVQALHSAQAAWQESQNSLLSFQASFQAQQAEVERRQQAARQVEQRQRAAQNRLAQAEGQLAQLQERLQEAQRAASGDTDAEGQRLTAELESLVAQMAKLQTAVASARQRATELSQKRHSAQTERQKLIQQLQQLRRQAKEQSQTLMQQQKEVARLEARVEMLTQMRQQDARVGGNIATLGRLAQFLTIPPELETAVTAALHAHLSTLLLAETADLWQLLSGQRGPLSAAVLADLQPPPSPPLPQETAVLNWASQLVTCQPEAVPLAQLLLGRVLLVQDATTAYRLAQTLPVGATAVSLDGFVAHVGGLVELNGRQAQNDLLAREAEWRQRQAELARLRQELATTEQEANALNAQIQAIQAQADAQQEEERRLGRLENEATQRATQAQNSLERAQQQQRFLQRQQESLQQRAAAQQQEIVRLQARLQEAETGLVQLRHEVEMGETAVLEARQQVALLPIAEASQQRQSLQQSAAAAQTIVAGRQAVVDSRRATLGQLEAQLERLRQRHSSLQAQQQQLVATPEDDEQQRLQQRLQALTSQLEPAQAALDSHRQEMRALEEQMTAVQRRALELETQYTQAQVRLSQEENHIEGLQERIKADLGIVALVYDQAQTGPTPLPISDVVEQLPIVNELPPDIEESIHHYRGQMQRMGAINPDAPEEYESTQERYDFLTQQVEDLNQTEKQLREVIAELDQLTSTAFAETVEKVNQVFGQTFTQLFNGGAARLVLTDPDDLTISGVDIIARLPNRREQGLGLLSGGERSLTAVALIFSLLKVAPTPFCVLDEVDAALDEANVNRFRELLRELSLKTQFIVITHNRGTVQAAQTIYGISMGADSASQSISIKPEEYLKQAAQAGG